ncbi:cupin protein [Fusarium austroafricanum]|uniref:Cupin protein n=1 Tax=Fusarium austroafricanum TaxID=2364996 RepID=A0A8H4P681_9HYPO|nr:cupin protein [Fusarium austroafricanum]
MTALPEPILYHVKPTKLIPNSPKPLLLYKNAFMKDGQVDRTKVFDTFRANSWDVQWVTRYGRQQRSHYHAQTHEVMVVVSGPGRIRWGVADLSDDWQEHTYGKAYEDGGLEVEVNVGDLFVIPAGVAHKSYDPTATVETFGSMTGAARGIVADNARIAVAEVPLEGFCMMGAYPRGFSWTWDEGGDSADDFEAVWKLGNPAADPVTGEKGGLNKYWKNQVEGFKSSI